MQPCQRKWNVALATFPSIKAEMAGVESNQAPPPHQLISVHSESSKSCSEPLMGPSFAQASATAVAPSVPTASAMLRARSASPRTEMPSWRVIFPSCLCSSGASRVTTRPCRPQRPVRPARWRYVSANSGSELRTTQSTSPPKSRPRAEPNELTRTKGTFSSSV
eukprot:scaffold35432_cov27-Tisochrysis_lutea.AAC.1